MRSYWQASTCRFKIFQDCVDQLFSDCPNRWTVFKFWNSVEENPALYFSEYEMSCAFANIRVEDENGVIRHYEKQTQAYCGIDDIKGMLNECVLIVPISDFSPNGICRFRIFKNCVRITVENKCVKVWNVFNEWNDSLDKKVKFSEEEIACERSPLDSDHLSKNSTIKYSLIILLLMSLI